MGRKSKLSRALVLLSGLIVIAQESHGYTPTQAANGAPVRWKGTPHLYFAGNPQNQSGLSDQDIFDAAVHGLQRWKEASGQQVGFDYWQGRDAGTYPPASAFDGLSTVYFASNAKSDPSLSPNVLGLTQVWYDTKTGEILETDIVLNDRNFHFTMDPHDTSGYGTGSGGASSSTGGTGGRSSVFIENVLTHEIGHSLGLSHSGGLQSTMLFMESPEQAYLGCDELTAVHALYPGGDAGARGALSGQIRAPGGTPVFGAHVLAISRKRGTVLATALTDPSGHYRIDALEPGEYYVLAEPFFAGPQTLPPYFEGMRSDVCPGGQTFSRTVLTQPDGFRLQNLAVSTGGEVAAPELVVHCSQEGGAAVVGNMAAGLSATAPLVFDGSRNRSGGFGITDRFSFSDQGFYRLEAVSGRLEIHVLSYSLYSPIRPVLDLRDADGRSVRVTRYETVYEGNSGFVNFDSQLVAEGLPQGSYTLEVSGLSVSAALYPAGPVSIDQTPFFVITGSVNEGAPALVSEIPNNARCRLDENFPVYLSPAGPPVRHSTDTSSGVGFCGNVSSGGGDGGGGGGPDGAQIVGWLLPYVLAALIARAGALALRNRRGYAKL